MKPWSQVLLLAKREFIERAISKPFLVTMGLIVTVILAIGPIVGAVSGGEEEATKIGLTGDTPPGFEAELADRATMFEMDVVTVRLADRSAAESAVTDGDVTVALIGGEEMLFHTYVSTRIDALVRSSIDAAVKGAVLGEMGLTEDEANAVLAPVPVQSTTLEEDDPQEDAKRAAAFMGAIALYISIIMFGQFVAMGTVEEKQNRVVEVILSRVRPWQVLVGKVVGIGLLGLTQLALLTGAAYVSVQFVELPDIDIAAIGVPIIVALFFWFILGYTFYAFLYAAVGSTVSRQEDLQGAIMLPIVLIMPGYILAIVAAESPSGLAATVGSWMPMWAPFVMPVRIAAGVAQPWEVIVAIVGTAVGAVALVWLGARVYSGALLRTGGKVKLREAWRAASE
ncbi:MAG: ABC transporter permease [Actinomycetota bacterium]